MASERTVCNAFFTANAEDFPMPAGPAKTIHTAVSSDKNAAGTASPKASFSESPAAARSLWRTLACTGRSSAAAACGMISGKMSVKRLRNHKLTLTLLRKVPEAAEAYSQALARAPSPALALRHAAALRASGQTPAATAALHAWLTRNPLDDEAGLMLAQLDIEAGRMADAQARLEAIVERQPQDAVALNNLAWLLGEQPGEASASRARALAERAYFLAPGPDVADTLGWILARSGQAAQAVPLLRQSAGSDPGSAYRLAFALHAAGEREEARRVLAPLLAAAPTFPERANAVRLLAELNRAR